MYQVIEVNTIDNVLTIHLNRPEKRNAINALMIEELLSVFTDYKNNESIKLVLLKGNGTSFSSGADLEWLTETNSYSYDKLFNESQKLISLLEVISTFDKPVISIAKGSSVGAGVGIMLSSDIIISEKNTIFGVSEVAIGVVPVAIIPLLIQRIGLTKTKELVITGNRFNALEALKMNLINYALEDNEIEEFIIVLVKTLKKNGSKAMSKSKEIINQFSFKFEPESKNYIAKEIANLRLSSEAKEGINSFLEKRDAKW